MHNVILVVVNMCDLLKENKKLKEELLDTSTALLIEIQTGKELFKKLEKIKEIAIQSHDHWTGTTFVATLKEILASQEKE